MAINDAGMFTVKEINRLKILQDVIDRNLRPGQAAEMLGITPRHCSRLLKRYRQYGPLGMNNQSRGRTGNCLLPASLTDQALSIIREHYRDFGPTLAREKLEEVHGLVLGKETIRRLMINAGLWIPRRQRAPKIGSHNDVMLKRPLREVFSQRPFQHMDISNEPVIRHFH